MTSAKQPELGGHGRELGSAQLHRWVAMMPLNPCTVSRLPSFFTSTSSTRSQVSGSSVLR